MTINHILAGVIFVGTIAAIAAIPEPSLHGSARIIDGDTIEINHQRIRLWGIDAPERSQPLGPAATAFLEKITRNTSVTCTPHDKDKYSRVVAQCRTSEGDIGRRLVANGMAIDYTRYSRGFYRDEEQAAREARLGLWAGPFTAPETWRKTHK